MIHIYKIRPNSRLAIVAKNSGGEWLYLTHSEFDDAPLLCTDPFDATLFSEISGEIKNCWEVARKVFPELSWTIREISTINSYFICEGYEHDLWKEVVRAQALSKLSAEEKAALDLPLSDQLDDEVPFSGEEK